MPHRPFPTQSDAFAVRLRSVVDGHGGASALARVIARSEGAVRKWLRAESVPNVTDLRAICEATATNVTWLVNGNGAHTPAASPTRTAEERAPHLIADCALLETLLERIDAELAHARLSLTPTKRSALIVTLYQLSREHMTIDSDAITRLVKLAQA